MKKYEGQVLFVFEIHMGIPEMSEFWDDLSKKVRNGSASRDEEKTYKRLGKTFIILSENPRHPSLKSHNIDALTARYGIKVWESYVENDKPATGKIFWVYGPSKNSITIIGFEPHPNDKSNAYKKNTLSAMA